MIMPTGAVLKRARALYLEQQWAFWDATLVSALSRAHRNPQRVSRGTNDLRKLQGSWNPDKGVK
jgi:hypothetical protein